MAKKYIAGTDEADVLAGGAANEFIEAFDGDDVVVAGDGNDTVFGGAGNDVLAGEDGDDVLVGDTGNDVMLGGDGNDRMIWNNGDGSDIMEGGKGYDTAEANGSDTAGDHFVIETAGDRVNFERVNFGPFSLNIGSTERMVVNGLGGDDIVDASGLEAGSIKLKAYGGEGNDTLIGGAGDDYLDGGDGDDHLEGEKGNDIMKGGAGNDVMEWDNGDGSDIMDGGEGFDIVEVEGAEEDGDTFAITNDGQDVTFARTNLGQFTLDISNSERLNVDGLGGNDHIDASALEAGVLEFVAHGGDGNDTLIGSQGDDYLYGDYGNDVLVGGKGNDVMKGGAGKDTMIWNNGDGSDVMNGGKGYDTAVANGSDTGGDEFVITGGEGHVDFQRVNFGPFSLDISNTERMVVNGLGGDDIVNASELEAGTVKLKVYGGEGNDTITGSQGDDFLHGGNGDDLLIGGPGADVMKGGAGKDTMVWNNGDGSDVMDGGTGYDTAVANGSDTGGDEFVITGGDGHVDFQRVNFGPFSLDISNTERMVVNGLGGDDIVNASELEAGTVKLKVYGGEGNDTITGSQGDDLIDGGAGNDVMTGGDGADTFVFALGEDRITDFEDGYDVIRIAVDGGYAGYGDIEDLASQHGDDVVIDFGGGNSLTLENTSLHDIDQSDFVF